MSSGRAPHRPADEAVPRPSAKKSGRPLAAKTLAIRDAVIALQAEGQRMTVRGTFYALTVRGIVDKTEAGYRQVQRQVLLLRREGLLPWGFIADATRWQRKPLTFDRFEDALAATKHAYRRNLWRSQSAYVEIWLEKDALASVLMDVTDPWDVALMVSRGQSSDTFCYEAAQTIDHAVAAGFTPYVFLLYDADRSGRVAARKIEEKLQTYSRFGDLTRCRLLAVTDEQITDWNLPTRPAKENADEIAVELDAIPPRRLTTLVEEAIISLIDADAWKKEQAVEASERELEVQVATQSPEEAA